MMKGHTKYTKQFDFNESQTHFSVREKRALKKMAKGAVFDVKITSNVNYEEQTRGTKGLAASSLRSTGERGSGAAAQRATALRFDERERRVFVAFNTQLRMLRWGWRETLGIDQLVRAAHTHPGRTTTHLSSAGL